MRPLVPNLEAESEHTLGLRCCVYCGFILVSKVCVYSVIYLRYRFASQNVGSGSNKCPVHMFVRVSAAEEHLKKKVLLFS